MSRAWLTVSNAFEISKKTPKEYLLEFIASLILVCISIKAIYVDRPLWNPNCAGDNRANLSRYVVNLMTISFYEGQLCQATTCVFHLQSYLFYLQQSKHSIINPISV